MNRVLNLPDSLWVGGLVGCACRGCICRWCEEVVTEEEKSFVTQSTDSPWTEVMSVKGVVAVTDPVSNLLGDMEGEVQETRRVGLTSPPRPPGSPHAKLLRGATAAAASRAVRAKDLNDLQVLAQQHMAGGDIRNDSTMTYASAVTRTMPPGSPAQAPPTRMRRRGDSDRVWEGLEGEGREEEVYGYDDEGRLGVCTSDGERGGDDVGGAVGKENPELASTCALGAPGDGGGGAGAGGMAQTGDPLAATMTEGKRLRIIDARPIMNAKGNALMGKGHEIIARLGGEMCTTLSFAGIENIHVMRESYGALRQICCELTRNTNWLQMLHETKWLLHLSALIRGSLVVALHLERGDPVLVHCSDGWDRTSQMVALAQLLLDPFYRTIAGEVYVMSVCVDG